MTVGNIIIIILTILLLFLTILFFEKGRFKLGGFTLDFNRKIQFEKELKKRRFESNESIDEKRYALLRQYHSQGLAQSKTSFWFSLIFASIGFIIISIGIFFKDPEMLNRIIKIGSGSIIDAVSALFFVQSNKARELMTEFFDKLRIDRKFEESLNLAEQIPDAHLKSKIKILLSLNFADIKTSDKILELILSGIEQPQANKS